MSSRLRTAGSCAAGDALEARAVAHHGELAAVAAGIALVALEARYLGGREDLGLRQPTATAADRHGGARGQRRGYRQLEGRGGRLGARNTALGDLGPDRVASKVLFGDVGEIGAA